MNKMVQGLLDNARLFRDKGAMYIHKAEMSDIHSPQFDRYLQRAASALNASTTYYETAYHVAADIYGENEAVEMLLDDIGNNCKLIDRLVNDNSIDE